MEDIQTIIIQKDSEIESLKQRLRNWEYATRNYVNNACYECVWNRSSKLEDPTSHCGNSSCKQFDKYPFVNRCSDFELKR